MRHKLCRRHVVAAAGIVLLAAAVGAQTTELQPGRYTVTIQVAIDGESQPPEEEAQCFAAADAKRIDRWIVNATDDSCVIADRKVDGGKILLALTCKKGLERWRTELTTTGDSFVFRMIGDELLDGSKIPIQITSTGKRTGDCAE
jgi:hypothetical protein